MIAVVIPSFKVKKHILDVLKDIGPEVGRIYVIDDCCPDFSGQFVKDNSSDARIHVVRLPKNLGVGGAVMTGYKIALEQNMEIIVKIDGDGQMDPKLIPNFVGAIQNREADYTKGNRFFDLEAVKAMPTTRLVGNAILSFMTKMSSGYWQLFDPTNGYTAIHAEAARNLPFDKISQRYFFETDMLFRLNTIRAVVLDIPMHAKYGDEVSNLKISKILGEFLLKHIRNLSKRLFYNYFLRDLSLASLQLPLGIALFVFGSLFGGYHWLLSYNAHIATAPGTVMLAALPLLTGVQLILAFLGADMAAGPTRPLCRNLPPRSNL